MTNNKQTLCRPMLRNVLLGTCLSGALALTAGTGAAFAQVDEIAGEQPEAKTLNVVIVTARRRTENLQDVPISVSAFNADQISTLQADTIAGLQNSVPNVYIDQGDGGNAVIYMRGAGQNDSLAFADPAVGVYVDDVFVARSQAAFLDMFDVERVEILRGPQGTLYGRNTMAGAIKFVSAPPPEEFEAYAEIAGGSDRLLSLVGRVGGPLGDSGVRGKLALSYVSRDGYATNTFDGLNDGDKNTLAGRATLAWEPTNKLSLSLSVDGKSDSPGSSLSPLRLTPVSGFADPAGDPFTLTTFPASPEVRRPNVNANRRADLNAFGITAKADYEISDAWTLHSVTGYREMEYNLNLDTDGSPLPILDILVLQDQDQFSQELRIDYDAGDKLQFTGGIYYFADNDTTFSGVDNSSLALFGAPITAFFPFVASSSLAETVQETRSTAIFGEVTYQLTPKLEASFGLRYTSEDKTSGRQFENFSDVNISVIQDTPPFLQGIGTPGTVIAGDDTFNATTPRFSLSYDAADNLLVYATVARGFKSGGFDGRGTSDFTFQAFKPETAWSYEGGFKSSPLDSVILNGAIFYNEFEDLQVTSFGRDPVSSAFVSLFTNAAEATTAGFELETSAQLTNALNLTGALGYIDAEYNEFNTFVFGVQTDVSDRSLVNTPEWTASAGATWSDSVTEDLNLTLHGDVAYRAKSYTEITSSEVLAQEGYVMANALVSLARKDEAWTLSAGVKNLTNENVIKQGFNLSEFPGYQLGFYGAPRTFEVRLSLRH